MSNKYVSPPGLSRFLNRLFAIFAKTSDLDGYVKKVNNPFRVGTGVSSACQKNASSSNTSSGESSIALGLGTTASGDNSHAGGRYTVANNLAEFAAGSYNASKKASTAFGNAGNTHFSLGIGTSNEGRKNAIEVMQNGDLYVIGLGGYDGTNAGSSGVKSFQTYINTLIGDALDEYYPQS